MLSFLFWIIMIFLTLICASVGLYFGSKQAEKLQPIFAGALLVCYFYVSVLPVVVAFYFTSQIIGTAWAVAVHVFFWCVPWCNGHWLLKTLLQWGLESSIDFMKINIHGNGIMTTTPLRYFGRRQFFFARGDENNEKVLNDVVRQVQGILEEKESNQFKRWKQIHWRWYAPFIGGWNVSKEWCQAIDHGVHNVNGAPITRITDKGDLELHTTEINM